MTVSTSQSNYHSKNPHIKSITIHASVTKIGYEDFYACDDLLILAPKGSAAEEYADTNDIPFKAI